MINDLGWFKDDLGFIMAQSDLRFRMIHLEWFKNDLSES